MPRQSLKNKQAEIENRWVGTSEMADYLSITSKVLIRMVKDGTFAYGRHFIDIREKSSALPVYRFNKAACLQRFMTPPERR